MLPPPSAESVENVWVLGRGALSHVTTVLEQDLFFSSYSRSIFSKYDELLTEDAETQAHAQSVMDAGCGLALQGRAGLGDRPMGTFHSSEARVPF